MSTQYLWPLIRIHNEGKNASTELPFKGQFCINKQLGLGEKNGSAMFGYEKEEDFLLKCDHKTRIANYKLLNEPTIS